MSERLKELVVLHATTPEGSDLNLLKLADFLGVPSHGDTLANSCDNPWEAVLQHSRGNDCAVCVSASTLRKCFDWSALARRLEVDGLGSSVQLFVYGFDPQDGDSELIHALSNGAFEAVQPLSGHSDQYCVSSKYRAFCQEFSGLTFGQVARENDLVFQVARKEERIAHYVRIGDRPFLAGIGNGAVQVTLAGTREILDIDAAANRGVRPLDWFSRLVPTMLFLRHAFGERCWGPARKLACFIVDDPLLRNRYGFLDYGALLESMQRENFATSVAFIPWNYRRSQPKVAQLFRANPERLSLSIHGCDHTRGEFGEADEILLSRKAATARKRLARHRDLTGVSFDNVMVFPQGIFSSAALRALKSTNYLAAVNSTPFSVDDPPHRLRVRDLLTPAVTCYSDLPLFIRHYPNRIADFALDLFLGKPALIVEHHDYFRSGYKKIQEFAGQINRLSAGITWCGLEEIVRNVCLVRRRDDGTVERRFYCNEALADSGGENVNGAFITTTGNGELSSALGNAELRFGSRRHRLGVSIRRHLSEFRDNYLSRSRLTMSAVRALRSKPKDSANGGRLEQGVISTTPDPARGEGQL